ncbi:LysM peptidoglycan-binding domain-containing protein [Luteimonas sp. BDR2-5]|uniref:LysM peptidoglycan-binding domain-containing protein n=1 Tax=Proluteimonas luteida TaxID=2878685 RepID=UPI001E58922F|nr:LysM peptidoglycan-binding domain-containing protein [Luteimonas sp. BDR2-5]MCD9027844.1 LysM peptidoglycan-binding domain-containing protein [Luteimonas sp. BDR2-5]
MSNDNKPDFSKVQGGVSTTEEVAAPKADFSNVQSKVTSTEEIITERSHTVEKNENLSKISKQYYGTPNRWREIFDANRDQLDNPDLIKPGQVLRIPGADAGTDNA